MFYKLLSVTKPDALCVEDKVSYAKETEYAYHLEILAELKNYYGWILDEIRPFFGQRMAEIGGGIGTFTDLFVISHLQKEAGTSLEVFEPTHDLYRAIETRAERAYASLVRTGRLKTVAGYFDFSRKEQFDTIIMINVLEHIQDDLEFVRNSFNSLAAGGTFVVFVPALQWLYGPLDKKAGHFRRYEKNQLEGLLRSAGFEVLKSKYMDAGGVLPWYLFHVIGKSESFSPLLTRFYDRWMIPAVRYLEGIVQPFIGKNVLIVGRKNPPFRVTPSPNDGAQITTAAR